MLPYFKKKQMKKINSVIIRNVQTIPYREVLLNNIIEEDLQSVLNPLDWMQSLFICAKYSIRDNFITSNSNSYNFLGLICAVIFRCLVFFHLMNPIWTMYGSKSILSFYNVCDSCFISIGFIINYCSNIFQSNNNALLVLKIQHVHRILKIDGRHIQNLVISNWAYVIILNFIYLAGNFYFWFQLSPNNILDLMSNYCSISFDINIAYATFVINLLRKTFCAWIKDIQISRNDEDFDSDSYWKLTYELYLNILEGYTIIEKTFRLLVVYYTIYTVSHGLMSVAILLQMKQINGGTESALFAVISQTWLVKSTALHILQCIETEKFYATMNEVRSVCTLLMKSRECSDIQRRICKNIQRQQRTSFKKLNTFGLFVVDARLPFQVYNILTTYTLTLLQFYLS